MSLLTSKRASKFVRSKYTTITLPKEVAEIIRQKAKSEGLSIMAFIEKILKYYEGVTKEHEAKEPKLSKYFSYFFASSVDGYVTIKNFSEHLLNSMAQCKKMFSMVSKTWNPVSGCKHGCKYCWARMMALTKLRNSKRYGKGFEPRLNKEELNVKFDKGIVFVSDMGDLFGNFIPDEWIIKVI